MNDTNNMVKTIHRKFSKGNQLPNIVPIVVKLLLQYCEKIIELKAYKVLRLSIN